MTFLGKELAEKQELQIKKVPLGGDKFTYVREMSGREKSEYEKAIMVEVKTENGGTRFVRELVDFRAKLAVRSICDEEGNLVFKPEDYAKLSVNIKASILEKICDEAAELSSISDEVKKETIKNSESDQPKEISTESVAS